MNDTLGLHESPENYAPDVSISAVLNYLPCTQAQLLDIVEGLKDKLKGTCINVYPESDKAIKLVYPVHAALPLKAHADLGGVLRFFSILDTVHSMVWLMIKLNHVSEELTR